jgi:hypothetical protein
MHLSVPSSRLPHLMNIVTCLLWTIVPVPRSRLPPSMNIVTSVRSTTWIPTYLSGWSGDRRKAANRMKRRGFSMARQLPHANCRAPQDVWGVQRWHAQS